MYADPILTALSVSLNLKLYFVGDHPGDKIEKRIKLVENNLIPLIRIEGEPNLSLDERMKYYHATGISIALIKNGIRYIPIMQAKR